MEFVTYSELNNEIIHYLPNLPQNIDIVVGVPRSGLMVATLIALYLNKPVVDIDSFCQKEISSVGETKTPSKMVNDFSQVKLALIVEDSINDGTSIRLAKEKIQKALPDMNCQYFAAYIRIDKQNEVDYYLRIIDAPRLFEWNYLHGRLKTTCFDIDGVLCVDPTEAENDDGEKYQEFLKNAKPKLIPSGKVGMIVTCRLEKYRSLTDEWLKKHGIEYCELIMMPYHSAAERKEHGNYAEFKAEVYKKHKEILMFVESSKSQAEKINCLSKKPVFCVENQMIYRGDEVRDMKIVAQRRMRHYVKQILPSNVIEQIQKIRGARKKRK